MLPRVIHWYTKVLPFLGPYHEEYWSLRKLPQIGIKLDEKDFDDMGNIITEALNSKELSKGREELENECWNYQGQAGARCVDYLMEKRKTILERKGE